jgi:CRISPR-associated protein Cmr4
MKTRPFLLHALSPLHAGTGQAVDVVDLPIARLRSTGMPFVPGSSIKGVLREARRDSATCEAVFGPDTKRASEHAGALVLGDARLLALPVRSLRGTFAWATSPLLLGMARRDLEPALALPALDPCPRVGRAALVAPGSLNQHGDGKVYLEDLDLPAQQDDGVTAWAEVFAHHVAPQGHSEAFVRRFIVLDDETMTFLWETATQVDARVRISPATRTVATGALWWEESLPPETVLVGLMAATCSMKPKQTLSADEVLTAALPKEETLQFGGKATVGRGRCRLVPLGVQ